MRVGTVRRGRHCPNCLKVTFTVETKKGNIFRVDCPYCGHNFSVGNRPARPTDPQDGEGEDAC